MKQTDLDQLIDDMRKQIFLRDQMINNQRFRKMKLQNKRAERKQIAQRLKASVSDPQTTTDYSGQYIKIKRQTLGNFLKYCRYKVNQSNNIKKKPDLSIISQTKINKKKKVIGKQIQQKVITQISQQYKNLIVYRFQAQQGCNFKLNQAKKQQVQCIFKKNFDILKSYDISQQLCEKQKTTIQNTIDKFLRDSHQYLRLKQLSQRINLFRINSKNIQSQSKKQQIKRKLLKRMRLITQ